MLASRLVEEENEEDQVTSVYWIGRRSDFSYASSRYQKYEERSLMKTVKCALQKKDEDAVCHPKGDHRYMKICRRRNPPRVDYGGAICKTSSRKLQSRKVFHIEAVKIVIIKFE
jgi:hypothetical protein